MFGGLNIAWLLRETPHRTENTKRLAIFSHQRVDTPEARFLPPSKPKLTRRTFLETRRSWRRCTNRLRTSPTSWPS